MYVDRSTPWLRRLHYINPWDFSYSSEACVPQYVDARDKVFWILCTVFHLWMKSMCDRMKCCEIGDRERRTDDVDEPALAVSLLCNLQYVTWSWVSVSVHFPIFFSFPNFKSFWHSQVRVFSFLYVSKSGESLQEVCKCDHIYIYLVVVDRHEHLCEVAHEAKRCVLTAKRRVIWSPKMLEAACKITCS